MKRNLLALTLVLTTAFGAFAQDAVPNMDMEAWFTDGTVGIQPTGYIAANTSQITGGGQQEGTYACRVETADQPFIGVIGGSLRIGWLNGFTVEEGEPYTTRVDTMAGYLRFDIPSGDIGLMVATFTKWDGASRITLGTVYEQLTGAETSWTCHEWAIDWDQIDTSDPDSVFMIISCSSNSLHDTISMGTNTIGSYIEVDDFCLGCTPCSNPGNVVVDLQDDKCIEVYPNPARNTISFSGTNAYAVQLFDLEGRLISTERINMGTGNVNIATYPEATYMYNVVDQSGSSLERGRFVKVD